MQTMAEDKPGRWVMEVARTRVTQFRELLVRHEKTTAAYEASLQLAAMVIVYI